MVSTNNIDELRKSEGVYKLELMQKLATVAATADGLTIEGNHFKATALTGCPDMLLFACETIIEQADKITELKAENARIKRLLDNGIKAAMQNADKLADIDRQVKELSGLIYNSALGHIAMGYSVDIESMAQHTYQITGINAEGKSKGKVHE